MTTKFVAHGNSGNNNAAVSSLLETAMSYEQYGSVDGSQTLEGDSERSSISTASTRNHRPRAGGRRACICHMGDACQIMSTAFHTMKDPRGRFILVPSYEIQLRQAYSRYLLPNNRDNFAWENRAAAVADDENDFCVAVHHFHPTLIDRCFDTTTTYGSGDGVDERLLPLPQRTIITANAYLLDDQDRVLNHQTGKPVGNGDEYWVVPSYSFDAAHGDLKQRMGHMPQLDLERCIRRMKREARRQKWEAIVDKWEQVSKRRGSSTATTTTTTITATTSVRSINTAATTASTFSSSTTTTGGLPLSNTSPPSCLGSGTATSSAHGVGVAMADVPPAPVPPPESLYLQAEVNLATRVEETQESMRQLATSVSDLANELEAAQKELKEFGMATTPTAKRTAAPASSLAAAASNKKKNDFVVVMKKRSCSILTAQQVLEAELENGKDDDETIPDLNAVITSESGKKQEKKKAEQHPIVLQHPKHQPEKEQQDDDGSLSSLSNEGGSRSSRNDGLAATANLTSTSSSSSPALPLLEGMPVVLEQNGAAAKSKTYHHQVSAKQLLLSSTKAAAPSVAGGENISSLNTVLKSRLGTFLLAGIFWIWTILAVSTLNQCDRVVKSRQEAFE